LGRTVKEIKEWLDKLDDTDEVSGYIGRKKKLYLTAYGNNGYSKVYPVLEMN
jgi:hypothetical protein